MAGPKTAEPAFGASNWSQQLEPPVRVVLSSTGDGSPAGAEELEIVTEERTYLPPQVR